MAQGPILGPLLFLIYINNDLSENLSTTTKLFAVDTSLFSIEPLHNTYVNHLNSDFRKISHLAVQWKMSFNPDPRKQAKEVIFSGKNLLFQ